MTNSHSTSPRLTLDVPSEARAGIPVPITLRVENPYDHPLELTLRGRTIAFDVIVRRADGAIAWQRLANAMIPAILRLEVMDPRAVMELRTEWDTARAAPGVYAVEGVLFTDGRQLNPVPVPIRLSA